jgi:hypothetical protein
MASSHYVNNPDFLAALVKHRIAVADALESGDDRPQVSNYIGECILKIANHLSYKANFINYSYRDEMISDGIENCILYFNDYNPDIGKNPFAYFTQVIYFAFLRRINKEEKNRYIIYKNFQETIINNGHAGHLVDGDDNHVMTVNLYDNINDFMERFEKKEAVKKEKRKIAKEGLIKFYEEENDEQRSAVSD